LPSLNLHPRVYIAIEPRKEQLRQLDFTPLIHVSHGRRHPRRKGCGVDSASDGIAWRT
jgi:hypothetical protein